MNSSSSCGIIPQQPREIATQPPGMDDHEKDFISYLNAVPLCDISVNPSTDVRYENENFVSASVSGCYNCGMSTCAQVH